MGCPFPVQGWLSCEWKFHDPWRPVQHLTGCGTLLALPQHTTETVLCCHSDKATLGAPLLPAQPSVPEPARLQRCLWPRDAFLGGCLLNDGASMAKSLLGGVPKAG